MMRNRARSPRRKRTIGAIPRRISVTGLSPKGPWDPDLMSEGIGASVGKGVEVGIGVTVGNGVSTWVGEGCGKGLTSVSGASSNR